MQQADESNFCRKCLTKYSAEASDAATTEKSTMWKCPKCGRALTSGGESIAESLKFYSSFMPELDGMTDIQCACGAILSAKDLLDPKQASDPANHNPAVTKKSTKAVKMEEMAENASSIQEPKSPLSDDVGQYRLQNGYNEFEFGILAPNMPNPFASVPAHCCACAQTIGVDQVGEKILFRGKKEIGPGPTGLGAYLQYEAPGIICSRCSSKGYHVGDFMQVGVRKGTAFSNLLLQVGNPKVAAIWRSHLDKYAEMISQAMKESPSLKQFAGIRTGATRERRCDPGIDEWLPPLYTAQSDVRCFVVTACCGDVNSPEVVALLRFRDKFLLQSSLGIAFVEIYYRISPPLARWLQKHPSVGQLVRRYFLQPIIKVFDILQHGDK